MFCSVGGGFVSGLFPLVEDNNRRLLPLELPTTVDLAVITLDDLAAIVVSDRRAVDDRLVAVETTTAFVRARRPDPQYRPTTKDGKLIVL